MSDDVKKTVEGLLPVFLDGKKTSKPYRLFEFLARRALESANGQPSFDDIRQGMGAADTEDNAIRNWFNQVRTELVELESKREALSLPLICRQPAGARTLEFQPHPPAVRFWRPSFENPTLFVFNELVFWRAFKRGAVLRALDLNAWDQPDAAILRKILDPDGHYDEFWKSLGPLIESRSYLSKGEVNARDTVSRWLRDKVPDIHIESQSSRGIQRDSPVSMLRDRHVVLLGEPRINSLMAEHEDFWKQHKNIPIGYRLVEEAVVVEAVEAVESRRLTSLRGVEKTENRYQLSDYPFSKDTNMQTFALVSRMPRQYGSRGVTTLIGSSHNRAIRHVAEALIDDNLIQPLKSVLETGNWFQAIARLKFTRGRDDDGEVEWLIARTYNEGGEFQAFNLD